MNGTDSNTILVVNDNPDRLEVMSLLLQRAGYRVLVASDGREAFTIAQHEHHDLIISDVMMPHLSGIDLCRAIRADNVRWS